MGRSEPPPGKIKNMWDTHTSKHAAQRRARRVFGPFTAANCPTCATPCCRKPTWVRPFDVVLVQELGYSLPVIDASAAATSVLLHAIQQEDVPDEGEPCDFLTESGCSFPADLRPFGCAALICEPMRRLLTPEELAPVESAVRELEEAHAALRHALEQP